MHYNDFGHTSARLTSTTLDKEYNKLSTEVEDNELAFVAPMPNSKPAITATKDGNVRQSTSKTLHTTFNSTPEANSFQYTRRKDSKVCTVYKLAPNQITRFIDQQVFLSRDECLLSAVVLLVPV